MSSNSYKKYDWQEVAKHISKDVGIWIVLNNNVYNVTDYVLGEGMSKHPDVIAPYFGKDITGVFRGVVHSRYARKLLSKYKIGEIRVDSDPSSLPLPEHSFKATDLPQIKAEQLTNIRISNIFVYPVKGCKLVSVPRAYVSHDGLLNDRIYAFCNKKSKKVINQLFFPRLSQLIPAFIEPNVYNFDAGVRINDMIVPLVNDEKSELSVTWRSCATPIKVYDQGPRIGEWITNFLGDKRNEYILVRIAKNNHRVADPYYEVRNAGNANDMSGFQNYYTVSVVSQESLDELNRRLAAKNKEELTWRSAGFRLNIVLEGLPAPHYEDYLKNIVFKSMAKTGEDVEAVWSRRRFACSVPCVNQFTSEVTTEPVETLSEYRTSLHLNDRIAPPGDDSVFWGSFFSIKQSGAIEVGQPLICKYQQLDSHRIWNTHYGFVKKNTRFKQIKAKL